MSKSRWFFAVVLVVGIGGYAEYIREDQISIQKCVVSSTKRYPNIKNHVKFCNWLMHDYDPHKKMTLEEQERLIVDAANAVS